MKKILIVDDVVGWQNYHKEILTELMPDANFYIASSAREAYDCLLQNNDKPFDIIITDLHMEADFEPKYAGEWLVEQIKTFKNYIHTRVVISSAAYNIKTIAENYEVDFIPKSRAVKFPQAYEFLIN
jgi:CheY-like chemotaxis protein